MKKIAVIGAGPMGLMATYELLKNGFDVTLYEKDDRIGGMSASFNLDGVQIERYYHFICATDYALFDLLKEFDMEDKLTWRATRMGLYYDGHLYPWGDPISLLRFPKLNLIEKFRYGLHVLYSKKVKNWASLDKENAIVWLKKWLGTKVYDVLWDKLFSLKFHELQGDLSAAWIGARIQRVAKSRKSLFEEKLGYLKGGSDVLLAEMKKRIEAMNGNIVLNADVREVSSESGKVTGVVVNDAFVPFDTVISTIPLPYVANMVPALSEPVKKQIAAIANVGVACVILKLNQPISPYFWMNINHQEVAIPGVIEYSNLNPDVGGTILYAPYYMPATHPKYSYSDNDFLAEVCRYLKIINPQFNESWIEASKTSRYGYAQTVCSPGFYEKLPPMKSEISGFYMADTAYYYPEDRSITESVQVGKQLSALAMAQYAA